MTEYSKINIIYRLQKWMDSVPGQTFLNYAYSWGASIVIAGTLFKLTHLPGANFMLFLGMGTEVVVFFLSAFDRPFDKTADGRELPTHFEEPMEPVEYDEDGYAIEKPVMQSAPVIAGGTGIVGGSGVSGDSGVSGGGTIIIGGGVVGGTAPASEAPESPEVLESPARVAASAAAGGIPTAVIQQGGAWVAQQQENTPEMAEAQSNYVDALNSLTEMLSKVSAQSERLTRDSEEMENLNRTLTGITKIYEMQLKAASQQVGTIDQINEQTRKMAAQIEELNRIYARMIEAMTVNMPAAAVK